MPILARIRDGAITVLALSGALVCWEARQALVSVNAELSAVLRDTGAAVAAWRVYSEESTAFLRSEETRTNLALGGRALRNLDRAVINLNQGITEIREDFRKLDVNLNSPTGLLPAATAAIRRTETISTEASAAIAASRQAIEAASADLHGTAAGLSDTLLGIQRTADSASRAIEQMRVVAADPAIPASLQSIAMTTKNIETITSRMAKPLHLCWRILRETGILTWRAITP